MIGSVLLLVTKHTNTLDEIDLIHLHMINKEIYILLFPLVDNIYKKYLQSDKYKENVIRSLNYMANLIDEFEQSNKLLTNIIFDYIITCYENWQWLTMNEKYQHSFKIPVKHHFYQFLHERQLSMNDILPEVHVLYTHYHRPTKSFTYYKTTLNV